MNISEYFYGTYNNHQVRRDRKLLLNRKEIAKLTKASEDPGYTIVPIKAFINEKGLAKMLIGVAVARSSMTSVSTIREREDKRSIDRMFKK